MNQKIRKKQDRKNVIPEIKGKDRQMRVAGNLHLQFGIKIFGLNNVSKKQKVLGVMIILILVIVVIALVALENPQLADKLIRVLETILAIEQILPSWKKNFGMLNEEERFNFK